MSQHQPPRQSLAALLRSPAAPAAAEADAAGEPASQPASKPAPAPAPALAPAPQDTQDSHAEAGATATQPAPGEAAPTFLRQGPRGPQMARWQWLLAAALGSLLVLQVVLADRSRLAVNPAHRPWLESLCGVLGCRLPTWQEPEAFTMLARSVLPVPGQAGTLQVEASFRNDARFAQALPLIELTLSTADGQVSGQRIFSPAEYLGQAAPDLLQPGQSAQARFQLVEPEPAAEAFHFRFR